MLPDLLQPHVGRHHLVLLILPTDIDSKLSHLNIFCTIFAAKLDVKWCICCWFFFFSPHQGRVEGG